MENRYSTKSGEMEVYHQNGVTICSIGNIRIAGTSEYLDSMRKAGEVIAETKSGRLLVDTRRLVNFDITTRAASVNALPELLLNKVPYLLVAVIKGSSLFENMSMQAAISVAKPLSRKFLDGKMFDNEDAAMTWLKEYKVPREFDSK